MSNWVFTCICGRESCLLKRFALNQTDRNCGMVYMEQRKRLYATILRDHLKDFRQMAFITGPRQVGKTTTCRGLCDVYLNWDNEDHRRNHSARSRSCCCSRRLRRDRRTADFNRVRRIAQVSQMEVVSKGSLRGWMFTPKAATVSWADISSSTCIHSAWVSCLVPHPRRRLCIHPGASRMRSGKRSGSMVDIRSRLCDVTGDSPCDGGSCDGFNYCARKSETSRESRSSIRLQCSDAFWNDVPEGSWFTALCHERCVSVRTRYAVGFRRCARFTSDSWFDLGIATLPRVSGKNQNGSCATGLA